MRGAGFGVQVDGGTAGVPDWCLIGHKVVVSLREKKLISQSEMATICESQPIRRNPSSNSSFTPCIE